MRLGTHGNGILTATVAAAILGLTSPASAVVLTDPINLGTFKGPIQMLFDGYSTENGVKAADETTWGAGWITSVFELGNTGNNFYSDGIPGINRIGFVFYGIADANIIGGGPFDIYNIGCSAAPCDGKIHVDFYLKTNASSTNFGTTLKIANRTAFDTFTGITDGTPFMKWELTKGIFGSNEPGGTDPSFDERNTTLFQNTNLATLPTTGDGQFYAECVSGIGCADFNSDQYPFDADFLTTFTLDADLTTQQKANGWEGHIAGKVKNPIPEPETLSLFGISLLGLGFVRRRKNKRA